MWAEQRPRGGSIPISALTLSDLSRVAKPFHLLKVEKLESPRNQRTIPVRQWPSAHATASDASASSMRRARARSFSVSLFNWPQAARMSRPRGVRTGLA